MWTLPAAQYQATASPASDEERTRSAGCTQAGSTGAVASLNGSRAHKRAPTNVSAGGIPDAPTALPELQRLSTNDIGALLADAAKFEHYISSHPHTRQVEAVVASLRQEVEVIEAKTIAVSTSDPVDIDALRAQHDVLSDAVAALRKEQSDWMSRNTEFHLEGRLRGLIEESERESMDLQEEWQSGVIEYNEFITKYLEVRAKIAERKLKLERFQEKLQRARLSIARRT